MKIDGLMCALLHKERRKGLHCYQHVVRHPKARLSDTFSMSTRTSKNIGRRNARFRPNWRHTSWPSRRNGMMIIVFTKSLTTIRSIVILSRLQRELPYVLPVGTIRDMKEQYSSVMVRRSDGKGVESTATTLPFSSLERKTWVCLSQS